MREPGYSDALRVLRDAAGGDLKEVLDAACEPVQALLDHQPEGLRDDATLLLVQRTGRTS
jgi:hypothetical protein